MTYTLPEGAAIGTFTANTLPASFCAPADAVVTYKIYGTSAGAGVETGNIINPNIVQGAISSSDGKIVYGTASRVATENFTLLNADTYTLSSSTNIKFIGFLYSSASDENYISTLDGNAVWKNLPYTFTISSPKYIRFSFSKEDGSPINPSEITDLMLTKGSTASASYIPPGYKILILNTSGVTENLLIDNPYKTNYYINENGQEIAYSNFNIYATETLDTSFGKYSFYFATYDHNSRVRIHGYSNGVWQQQIASIINTNTATITKPQGIDEIRISCSTSWTGQTLVKGSTPPDHYIPHRYKSNYDLFIGSTKLGEEEYLDYQEQKIYKMISGVLTPVDPPAPLPAINTYKGENTLSSTETLGDIELTGDWLAIMGSTEAESIDISFTVDAEEYIAFVTVDEGPSIQVSDTITMPSSADSFSLEVVAWGREQYTDTVYNALS